MTVDTARCTSARLVRRRRRWRGPWSAALAHGRKCILASGDERSDAPSRARRSGSGGPDAGTGARNHNHGVLHASILHGTRIRALRGRH